MTLGEKSDIKAAVDIIKACESINKDGDRTLGGAVNMEGVEAWLDRYAAESSDPLEALVVIRRRIANFRGPLVLERCANPSGKS